jgi:FSR family fosmidomycin resistance protein-like MFS transporter
LIAICAFAALAAFAIRSFIRGERMVPMWMLCITVSLGVCLVSPVMGSRLVMPTAIFMLMICVRNFVQMKLTTRQGLVLAALLTAVVVLRSYMGFNQALPWKSEGHWGLTVTVALVLGKAAGGFLCDKLGARKAAAISLLLAAAFYLFSANPLCGTFAVFLFNMTMPITLWAAARLFPGGKGFAFGLLTFALFLGYLPTCLGLPSLFIAPWVNAIGAVLSAVLLLGGPRKERTKC